MAHAESRYFPVRMIAGFLTPGSAQLTDFSLLVGQRFPTPDLKILRDNARQLANLFSLFSHYAAIEVRKTRKRLRK